jgi:hypothetical protein
MFVKKLIKKIINYFEVRKLPFYEFFLTFFFNRGNYLKKDINLYKICFAILSYERPDYLKICLNTLYKSSVLDLNITFFIIDDGSTNPLIKEIINIPSPVNFKVVRIFESKGKNNAGAAINRAIRIMSSYDDFDIIGWADPDCLFHRDWLIQTLRIGIWAKTKHRYNLLGPFTSFNSSDFEFHKILGTYSSPDGDYVVKKQAGMLNYFFFKKDWKKFGPFEELEDDETLMTDKLDSHFVRNFSTKISYVEHVGQYSILNQWRDTKISRAVHGVNLAKDGWPSELSEVKTLGYYKDVISNVSFGDNVESNLLLDVFIPCAPKDILNLDLCIQGIKINLRHPINKIYVVAPNDSKIMELCDSHQINFLWERDVLDFDSLNINYVVGGVDRSKWLYQQLLKLSFDKFSLSENFLVIDSDTVLIQPQKFENDGKLLLQIADEFHKPYFDVYHRLLGLQPKSLLSSVTHCMIFNKEFLNSLKLELSKSNNLDWIDFIVLNTDLKNASGFSEYETYGLWCVENYENRIYREYFFNKFIKLSEDTSFNYDFHALVNIYGSSFKSISIHNY